MWIPRIALALVLFTAWGCSYAGSGGDGGSGDGDGQCRGEPPGAWEAYDFDFHPEWPECNLHSTQWYRCGVSIP